MILKGEIVFYLYFIKKKKKKKEIFFNWAIVLN